MADQEPLDNQFVEAYRASVQFLRPILLKAWDSRTLLLRINAAVLVLTVILLYFVVRPWYTCTVSILPDYGANASAAGSAISGLASLVTGGTGTPAEIYQSILSSETVMQPVLTEKRKTKAFKDSVSLIDYLDITDPGTSLPKDVRNRLRFLATYKKMENDYIVTNIDPVSKILTVSVTLPESKLAADVVNDIAQSLEAYVQTKRQSNAGSQRIYLQRRLVQVSDSLRMFEEELRIFQTENRTVTQSPELLLEQGRLSRNVELMQGVYEQLFQQLELVKVQEIQDSPIINIQELAQDPVVITGPKRLLIMLIVLILSAMGTTLFFGLKDELRKLWHITLGREGA